MTPLTPAGCSPRPLCGWFVSLSEPSIPPEEEKGPDTVSGVLPCHSAMDGAPSPWERGSFPGSQNGLSCPTRGTGQPARGSGDTEGCPAPMQGPPEQPNPPGFRESTQRGPGRAVVTPGQCPGEGAAKDHPGTAALSPRLLGMRLTLLLCILRSRRRGDGEL